MPSLTLNYIAIRNALRGDRAVYSITKHPRLYLATNGKGGGAWRLRYRPRAGSAQRWYTISNDAQNVAVDAVLRKMTEVVSKLSLDGIDPKATRKETKTTFGDGFALWLERHGKVHKKSWRGDEVLYQRHIGTRLGSDVLTEIDRQRVIEVLDDIAARATPIQANRCQSIISAVFSWCLDEGLVKAHPALRIRKRGAEVSRDAVMTDSELQAFWLGLEEVGQSVAAIIRLLLVLGARLQEIAGIKTGELHLNSDAYWVLPAGRSKNKRSHMVPLPPLSQMLIKDALMRAAGHEFLFPARYVADTSYEQNHVSRECKKLFKKIGRPEMRLHDLRHQAATGMARSGVPMEIRQQVQNQLTGRSRSIGAVYDQHEYSAEKLRALTLWQNCLLAVAEQREWPTEKY